MSGFQSKCSPRHVSTLSSVATHFHVEEVLIYLYIKTCFKNLFIWNNCCFLLLPKAAGEPLTAALLPTLMTVDRKRAGCEPSACLVLLPGPSSTLERGSSKDRRCRRLPPYARQSLPSCPAPTAAGAAAGAAAVHDSGRLQQLRPSCDRSGSRGCGASCRRRVLACLLPHPHIVLLPAHGAKEPVSVHRTNSTGPTHAWWTLAIFAANPKPYGFPAAALRKQHTWPQDQGIMIDFRTHRWFWNCMYASLCAGLSGLGSVSRSCSRVGFQQILTQSEPLLQCTLVGLAMQCGLGFRVCLPMSVFGACKVLRPARHH